jgi:uncharacterized protein
LAVVDEAQRLIQGLNWQASTMNVQLHFNQVLGALQHLTWDSIEKPKLKKQDLRLDVSSKAEKHTGARDALLQWAVLHDLLSPSVLTKVPDPEQANIPLDVFLRGLGHIGVSKALQDQVRLVDQTMQLKDFQNERNHQRLMKSLKALIEVMERDVAPALNVSVMFSSSDGD